MIHSRSRFSWPNTGRTIGVRHMNTYPDERVGNAADFARLCHFLVAMILLSLPAHSMPGRTVAAGARQSSHGTHLGRPSARRYDDTAPMRAGYLRRDPSGREALVLSRGTDRRFDGYNFF